GGLLRLPGGAVRLGLGQRGLQLGDPRALLELALLELDDHGQLRLDLLLELGGGGAGSCFLLGRRVGGEARAHEDGGAPCRTQEPEAPSQRTLSLTSSTWGAVPSCR